MHTRISLFNHESYRMSGIDSIIPIELSAILYERRRSLKSLNVNTNYVNARERIPYFSYHNILPNSQEYKYICVVYEMVRDSPQYIWPMPVCLFEIILEMGQLMTPIYIYMYVYAIAMLRYNALPILENEIASIRKLVKYYVQIQLVYGNCTILNRIFIITHKQRLHHFKAIHW